MLAVAFLAAANGSYLVHITLFVCGLVCGMLLLAVGELSVLGYLKFRELRRIWGLSKPAPEPADVALPDPLPAESHPSVADQPRLRVVTRPSATAATRYGHTVNARAALRHNAGYGDDDLSA